MSSADKNLSAFEGELPAAKGLRFALVTSEWNTRVTSALQEGAKALLLQAGAETKDIQLHSVPGSFELTLGAQYALESDFKPDAVICLGCVIQGETRHFDFICQAVADGITQLNIKHNKPVIFGVLTTNDLSQALERAGGKHGNKGIEAAVTALKMLALKRSIK